MVVRGTQVENRWSIVISYIDPKLMTAGIQAITIVSFSYGQLDEYSVWVSTQFGRLNGVTVSVAPHIAHKGSEIAYSHHLYK